MAVFQLLKRKWISLKEIAHVLSIPYKATVALQKQDLTLSDVFGIWLKMKLHLQNLSRKPNITNLAKHLLSKLEDRYNTIFSNPFMTCALFLDPRFRSQISHDEGRMDEAKTTLKQIWHRLKALNAPTSTDPSAADTYANASSEFDDSAEMEKYLAGSTIDQPNAHDSEEDIGFLLDAFNPPGISSKSNILEYWEGEKEENEALYKLAMVVFGIPPTEVQIERDFSKLNFVFGNRRCMLEKQRLEDIMVINLNPDLFYEVKVEQLSVLKSRGIMKSIAF